MRPLLFVRYTTPSLLTEPTTMNIFDLINADFATVTSPVTVADNCGFIVVGADSPQYLAESDRQRNEGQAYRRAANKGDVPKIDTDTEDGQAVFQTRLQANLQATAVAVTVGWFGFTDAAGAEVPFDRAMVAQMYAKKRAWRDAVISAIDEDKRFLPQAAPASPSGRSKPRGSGPRAK